LSSAEEPRCWRSLNSRVTLRGAWLELFQGTSLGTLSEFPNALVSEFVSTGGVYVLGPDRLVPLPLVLEARSDFYKKWVVGCTKTSCLQNSCLCFRTSAFCRGQNLGGTEEKGLCFLASMPTIGIVKWVLYLGRKVTFDFEARRKNKPQAKKAKKSEARSSKVLGFSANLGQFEPQLYLCASKTRGRGTSRSGP